jgi:hypothetical protein
MNKLNDVFDIEDVSPPLTLDVISTPVIDKVENSEDVDFEAARTNVYQIIDQFKAAIETGMLIASETQNPRALEVLSGLLKNAADTNKQLIQMSKDKQDVKVTKIQASVKGAVQQAPTIGTQQNVTFVGSSSQLNQLIADRLASMNT